MLLSLPILSVTLSPLLTDYRGAAVIQSFLYFSEPDEDPNSTCPGSLNTLPPWTGNPVKIREVENGSLYTAGDADDQLYGGCRLN